MEGKQSGEPEAEGPNMAGADGPSMAEADSTNIAAVKRGLNNIAEANETGGKAQRLIVTLMLLKSLNEHYQRYAHLWYVRAERTFIG